MFAAGAAFGGDTGARTTQFQPALSAARAPASDLIVPDLPVRSRRTRVRAAAAPGPPPRGAFTWATTTLPGLGVGEPGVAVGPEGTVYVNVPLSFDAGDGLIWKSGDGGRTWSRIEAIDRRCFGSGDTDVAVAPDDGTVYFVNLCTAGFTNQVYASGDRGATWSGPGLGGGPPSDRPWLQAGRNGVVYLTYHDLGLPARQIWMLRSDDRGQTFTPVNVNLLAGNYIDASCKAFTDRPLIDPKDPETLYLVYAFDDVASCKRSAPTEPDLAFRQIWLARSTDGGRSFTQHPVYRSEKRVGHLLPAAALDRAGNLYVAFGESTGEPGAEDPGETHVLLARSTDRGKSWPAPVRVDGLADHRSNVMPAIVAGDAGRIAVAWYASTASAYTDQEATWTVVFAQSIDALGPQPHFSQSRVSDTIVHVGDICQAGLLCAFGGNRNLLDFLGISVDPQGMAHVVWANDLVGEPLDDFLVFERGLSTAAQYGRQTSGPSLLAAPAPRRKAPAKVEGAKRRLPSTGVETPVWWGLACVSGLAVLGRLRRDAPSCGGGPAPIRCSGRTSSRRNACP